GFRRDAPGSLMLGLRHGAYCVGCCWALMALLLVGGVMNLLWIVLLALLIVLEKVTPSGRLIAHLAGIVLLSGGAWLLATGMSRRHEAATTHYPHRRCPQGQSGTDDNIGRESRSL